jgi:hypothetical protein
MLYHLGTNDKEKSLDMLSRGTIFFSQIFLTHSHLNPQMRNLKIQRPIVFYHCSTNVAIGHM